MRQRGATAAIAAGMDVTRMAPVTDAGGRAWLAERNLLAAAHLYRAGVPQLLDVLGLPGPRRIHRPDRGWAKPDGVVDVSTPRWVNPYHRLDLDPAEAQLRLRALIACRAKGMTLARQPRYPTLARIRKELAGRDLACTCPLPLDGPDVCHAVVLIIAANGARP